MSNRPEIDKGEIASLYSSGRFDPEFYRRTYSDVDEIGFDPAFHFLWLGAKLGRLPKPPENLLEGSSSELLDVLFIDGTNGTNSTPYRVDRIARGLEKLGLKVACATGRDLGRVAAEKPQARYVTFFRAPFLDQFQVFARSMRASGSRIVFDVDDLIFEEEQIPIIDGYRYLSEIEKVGYLRGVRAYREFALFADICTAPTYYLANRMRALGKRAYRVRNSIDDAEVARFDDCSSRGERKDFVVGYYSGSKTHQADFRRAGEALAAFMEEEPSARLRLVGHFDLNEYPELVRKAGDGDHSRVTLVPPMSHSRMLHDQLHCDVIVAPLEVGNPFCEAKSELKFFEASLARRPVIASPTETFRRATLNGELAQLADSSGEWLEAFRSAFSEASRYAAVARIARQYALEQYSTDAAANDVVLAYSDA